MAQEVLRQPLLMRILTPICDGTPRAIELFLEVRARGLIWRGHVTDLRKSNFARRTETGVSLDFSICSGRTSTLRLV